MSEIELPHQIIYNTQNHVEVSIVANSLLANEALIKESVNILECILDGASHAPNSV